MHRPPSRTVLSRILPYLVALAFTCPLPARAQESIAHGVPGDSLWGIADTHAHQFANLAFGGLLFWGAAYAEDDSISHALRSCRPAHGWHGSDDLIGGAARSRLFPFHATTGFPSFQGWPVWNTIDHQQMYVDWLKRAYRGGLRLMVMHAVNSEGLCSIVRQRHDSVWATDPVLRRNRCDDMTTVRLQLDAARRLERHIDDASGGPGKGWYRIVRTPDEARHAIASGKLAVVLGIEVDDLFGCKVDGPCTPESVADSLQAYYDLGVRHIIPVHLANNAFGGFAIYGDFFAYNNRKLTGRYPYTRDCSGEGIEFRLSRPSLFMRPVFAHIRIPPPHEFPGRAHCNQASLTPLGGALLEAMMQHGMLIDIDHMSRLTAAAALDLAAQHHYPVVGGHSGFLDISVGQNRHEGQHTREELASIHRDGGMVSVIFHQGTTRDIAQWRATVINNCSLSSRSWAQGYLYAVEAMGGRDSAGVGIGSDQSLLAWISPRFGKGGCAGNSKERSAQETSTRVHYPLNWLADSTHGPLELERSVAGTRVFDFNTDGLAEIGMLPDFVQDLENIGLSEADLKPLFHSAERYIEVWDAALHAVKR